MHEYTNLKKKEKRFLLHLFIIITNKCGKLVIFEYLIVLKTIPKTLRWRFLTPRAMLVLPFDLRLYLPKMHNFWRRFVNVVFIRARGGRGLSPRLNANRSQRRHCLELSSVSFPAPVDPDHPETWLPLPLATWYVCYNFYCLCDFLLRRCENVSSVKVGKIFVDKTMNMLGEVFKVAFFQHPPAAQRAEKSESAHTSLKKFRGVEVQVRQQKNKIYSFFYPVLLL